MKRIAEVLVIVLALGAALTACKNDQGPAQGEGFISGFVTDAATRLPLPNANVDARTISGETQSTTTKANGEYSLKFGNIDSATAVTISLRNNPGYRDTLDISVMIRPGVPVTKDVQLSAKSVVIGGGGVGGGSGLAQTIAFLGATPREISVYGVGGQETSILGWEVRDSLGLPIDAAHSVALRFTALSAPNGGEYISPSAVTTNAVGQAYTTFNSGIKSGVLQIVATATVGNRTITSSPVRMVINAGFPDQAHFTIGAERFNFPTLGIVGNRDGITVLVGDKYSNPVVVNTAVYFRSSAGVIQPSVFTNSDGQGKVDLISGNPAPFLQYAYLPADANGGYHYVVARTVGEGGVSVLDSVLILWSGGAQIKNVTPGTFDIANNGSLDFTFEVSDYLHHPLAKGTTITVQASVPPPPDPLAPVNQVQLSFGRQGSITLDDFLNPGPGRTEFGFRLSDGTININEATPVSVSITVSGPNNNAYVTLNGIVH